MTTRANCAEGWHELAHLILTVTLARFFPDCTEEKTEAELVKGRERIRFQEAYNPEPVCLTGHVFSPH